MNKKNIQIVIAFSFIALLGTVGIQYYWISKIYQQNHLLFDQNINNALKYAIKSLDQEEDIFYFNHTAPRTSQYNQSITINTNSHANQVVQVTTHIDNFGKAQNNQTHEFIHSDCVDDSIIENIVIVENSPQKNVQIIHEDGEIKVISESSNINTFVHINIDHDSIVKYLETKSDSLIKILKYRSLDLEKEKENLEATVEQLVWEMDEFSRPFADSLPIGTIQQVLDKAIDEYKLPKEYEFALLINNDSLLFSSEAYTGKEQNFTYTAKLFPYELISRNQSISVQFLNNPLYIKLFVPISLSLGFTIILLFGFLFILLSAGLTALRLLVS